MADIDRHEIDRVIELYLNKLILNKSQFKRSNDAINGLCNFFSDNNDELPDDISCYEQGSFATRTTVQPLIDEDETVEFDVDVVLESRKWVAASGALKSIAQALGSSSDYSNRSTTIKHRCVRVQYAEGPSGEKFHLDITPILVMNGHRYVAVSNNTVDQWELSDPVALINWFKNFAASSAAPTFRPLYILFKRLAQMNGIIVPSIYLQRLVYDSYIFKQNGHYLRELLELSRNIKINLSDPNYQVLNPVNEAEDLGQRIGQEVEDKIKQLSDKISRTIVQYTQTDNYQLLTDLFGDRLPATLKHFKELPLRNQGIYFDCDYAGQYKIEADCDNGSIAGSLYELTVPFGHLNSETSRQNLDSLKFKLSEELQPGHIVKWQVMNDPGEVPFQIRGHFEDPNSMVDDQPQRTEAVSWAGKHWIRAFVLENDRCRSISNKFRVNVLREVP